MLHQVRFALVADLVGSRQVCHRNTLSHLIEAKLQSLGQRWRPSWLAPPLTTRGLDQISAVMISPRHAFDFAVELNLAIWPARFRVAVASGTIDLGEPSGNAADMDGPAFHRAAAALERAEENDLLFAVNLEGLSLAEANLLESAARLHADIMQDWKPSRAKASAMIRTVRTQSQAAEQLGIRQQSVSEALAAAHARNLQGFEDAVRICLAATCR